MIVPPIIDHQCIELILFELSHDIVAVLNMYITLHCGSCRGLKKLNLISFVNYSVPLKIICPGVGPKSNSQSRFQLSLL